MRAKFINESVFSTNSDEKTELENLKTLDKSPENLTKIDSFLQYYEEVSDRWEKIISGYYPYSGTANGWSDVERDSPNQFDNAWHEATRMINSLNESALSKDIKRINDLFSRSKGDDDKLIQLTNNMANSIKDKEKAFRRTKAAWQVLGKDNNPIADIFLKKYNELGGNINRKADEILNPSEVIGSLMPKEKQYKSARSISSRWANNGGNPILPVGRINLTTGECKYFNVYDTWEDSTAEIWWDYLHTTLDKPRLKLIVTSGDTPIYNIGDEKSFKHDQTGAFIGHLKMIDYCQLKHAKALIPLYGNSIPGYTYK